MTVAADEMNRTGRANRLTTFKNHAPSTSSWLLATLAVSLRTLLLAHMILRVAQQETTPRGGSTRESLCSAPG